MSAVRVNGAPSALPVPPVKPERHHYEHWRHGGWYVSTVRYPSGAVGCVSRNYSDRKWRIVTDSDAYPGSPKDRTFRNRDAAADAEWAYAQSLYGAVCYHPRSSTGFCGQCGQVGVAS